MNSFTIKGKPLVLPWGRTPRLDSGVRWAERQGHSSGMGHAVIRDSAKWNPFRGCYLSRKAVTSSCLPGRAARDWA
ncbi:hypothetical protein Tco_1286241 [Tanacetum coccineum]